MSLPLRQRLAAEFFGTFTLVFCGCGAAAVDAASNGSLGHVGISLVFGLVVMVVIYSIGDISGAHINPAVTIGFCVARRFDAKDIAPYIAAQCVAAVLACLVLRLLFDEAGNLGLTTPANHWSQAAVLEALLTFLLMWIILNVSSGAKEKGIMAGAAVGATIALEALFGGPISGASMNPARSLGPAIAISNLNTLWIYLTAPTIGAVLAIPAFRLVRENEVRT